MRGDVHSSGSSEPYRERVGTGLGHTGWEGLRRPGRRLGFAGEEIFAIRRRRSGQKGRQRSIRLSWITSIARGRRLLLGLHILNGLRQEAIEEVRGITRFVSLPRQGFSRRLEAMVHWRWLRGDLCRRRVVPTGQPIRFSECHAQRRWRDTVRRRLRKALSSKRVLPAFQDRCREGQGLVSGGSPCRRRCVTRVLCMLLWVCIMTLMSWGRSLRIPAIGVVQGCLRVYTVSNILGRVRSY